eukprot:765867-Hanusia_phi.AAC.2
MSKLRFSPPAPPLTRHPKSHKVGTWFGCNRSAFWYRDLASPCSRLPSDRHTSQLLSWPPPLAREERCQVGETLGVLGVTLQAAFRSFA